MTDLLINPNRVTLSWRRPQLYDLGAGPSHPTAMRAVLGALLSRAAWGSDLAYVVRPEGCAYDRRRELAARGGGAMAGLARAHGTPWSNR